MPPTTSLSEEEWPSLSVSPEALIGEATVRLLLGGLGDRGTKTRPLAVAFIRVVARALLDINRARQNRHRQGNGLQDIIGAIQAIGDLENCILSLHRALALLDVLRSRGLTNAQGETIELKPRELPVLASDARTRLTAVRDAISHMDERIAKGEFPVGEPTATWPKGGSIILEGTELRLIELVSWLDQIASTARRLAREGARDRRGAA